MRHDDQLSFRDLQETPTYLGAQDLDPHVTYILVESHEHPEVPIPKTLQEGPDEERQVLAIASSPAPCLCRILPPIELSVLLQILDIESIYSVQHVLEVTTAAVLLDPLRNVHDLIGSHVVHIIHHLDG